MRLLLISTLAATLVGCSSASQQTHQGFEYADRGLYETHYEQSSQVRSKRRVLHARAITAKKTNTRHRKKMGAPSFTPLGYKSSVVTMTPSSETKTENPPSSQLDDEAKKTEIPRSSQFDDEPKKTEIPPSSQFDDEAKKTEIPPSSQLDDEAKKTEIPPSSRLDDESVMKKAKATVAAKMRDPDSIEFENSERAARKNVLGNFIDTICGFVRDKSSGPKPFLYVVQKDEAYVGGYTIATSEYRHICSITTLPDTLSQGLHRDPGSYPGLFLFEERWPVMPLNLPSNMRR